MKQEIQMRFRKLLSYTSVEDESRRKLTPVARIATAMRTNRFPVFVLVSAKFEVQQLDIFWMICVIAYARFSRILLMIRYPAIQRNVSGFTINKFASVWRRLVHSTPLDDVTFSDAEIKIRVAPIVNNALCAL